MDDGDKILNDKNNYLNITIFDCFTRIYSLEKFKALLINYRDEKISQGNFRDFRSNINQSVAIIKEYVATPYISVLIGHKFPGRMGHTISLLFRLKRFSFWLSCTWSFLT